MKALMATRYGDNEVMRFGELPEPVAKKNEVIVSVEASSVNPVDWKVRDGMMSALSGSRFPKALGCDFAGVVSEIGPGGSSFTKGDAVYGLTPVMFGKPGAHAERLAISQNKLRRIPEGVSFAQAAALPVAGLTAVDGLKKSGELGNRRVVVVGATGGVGHFALQLAKAEGAEVTAICSTGHVERAHALGADHVIDYTAEDFTKGAERYDIVFDAWGSIGARQLGPVLGRKGCYITTAGSPGAVLKAVGHRLLGAKKTLFAMASVKNAAYETLEKHLIAGQVTPVIDHVFSLEQGAEAFALLEQGGVVGKVIINIAEV